MTHELREQGLAAGRRRVARLMREHGCRGRSIFVPPDRCGVVARGAEPSKSNSAASYGVINGFSSVTFQLAAAAMAHVSSAPWYKNGPPFRSDLKREPSGPLR